eukprot:365889-Chlamydomonas_euryale.AAC.8
MSGQLSFNCDSAEGSCFSSSRTPAAWPLAADTRSAVSPSTPSANGAGCSCCSSSRMQSAWPLRAAQSPLCHLNRPVVKRRREPLRSWPRRSASTAAGRGKQTPRRSAAAGVDSTCGKHGSDSPLQLQASWDTRPPA